ncbi:MAG: TauD/TfdA family dioxygenase [Chromatiaceae bacterium]|nr:TauD/TfdA family dioxygenase [Chromatiaceae bacterium]
MSATPDSLPSPFDPDQPQAYAHWREAKLARHPVRVEDLVVEVADPRDLTRGEHQAILERCRSANMAVYVGATGADPDKELVRGLGAQLGLHRLDQNPGADEDAITSLTVQTDERHRGYIPYTNRPIAWHTDGYYNTPERQIHAVMLHCVRPAESGGENELLDHEMAYLQLRDRAVEYVRALMHPQAMTIPANEGEGGVHRADQSGPVFSIQPDGHLHMRYTDRKRNVLWRDDPLTREAVEILREILYQPSPWHFRVLLRPGWGILGNNVLHTRAGFTDGASVRLLYRARYYDRIAGT